MKTLARAKLYAQPEPGTINARIHAAIEALDQAGIYAAVSYRTLLTRGDAWSELDKETPAGMTPAMGDREDGALYWSFPYDQPTVARQIVKAFEEQGFDVSWDSRRRQGYYLNRVEVQMGGAR